MAITLKAMRGKGGRGNKWAKLPKADPPTDRRGKGGVGEIADGKTFQKRRNMLFLLRPTRFLP